MLCYVDVGDAEDDVFRRVVGRGKVEFIFILKAS